jgi:hypothetical protein
MQTLRHHNPRKEKFFYESAALKIQKQKRLFISAIPVWGLNVFIEAAYSQRTQKAENGSAALFAHTLYVDGRSKLGT